MKSKWIDHQGKKILCADYTNFGINFKALKGEADYVAEILENEPEKSVLLLVDVRNTSGISENTDYLSKLAMRVKGHVAKTAVVGVEGYRKIFLRAVTSVSGMQLTPVDDIEEAKNWLVE